MGVETTMRGVDKQELVRLMTAASHQVDLISSEIRGLSMAFAGLAAVIIQEFKPALDFLDREDRRRTELRRLAKEQVHGRR